MYGENMWNGFRTVKRGNPTLETCNHTKHRRKRTWLIGQLVLNGSTLTFSLRCTHTCQDVKPCRSRPFQHKGDTMVILTYSSNTVPQLLIICTWVTWLFGSICTVSIYAENSPAKFNLYSPSLIALLMGGSFSTSGLKSCFLGRAVSVRQIMFTERPFSRGGSLSKLQLKFVKKTCTNRRFVRGILQISKGQLNKDRGL